VQEPVNTEDSTNDMAHTRMLQNPFDERDYRHLTSNLPNSSP
jgi:hypothetical protein